MKPFFFLLSFIISISCTAQDQLKIINVNIYGTSRMNVPEWNDWNIAASLRSGFFRYSDGSLSTVTSVMQKHTGYADNGAGYLSTSTVPTQMIRDNSYESGNRSDTLKGLKDGYLYDLILYASRNKTGQGTRFTINGIAKAINTHMNATPVIFNNLEPVNGRLIIAISSSLGQFNYLNGFTLFEKPKQNTLIVSAGIDTTLILPINGALVSYQLQGTVSGDSVSFTWDKIQQSVGLIDTLVNTNTLTPRADSLMNGAYKYRLTGRDKWGNQAQSEINIVVLLNPKQSVVQIMFAGKPFIVLCHDGTYYFIGEGKQEFKTGEQAGTWFITGSGTPGFRDE